MNQSWHEDLIALLKAEYETLKRRNPRYSLRAYAKRLGLSSGGLSDLLNGKSTISAKRALKLVRILDDSSSLKNFILYKLQGDPEIVPRSTLGSPEKIFGNWLWLGVLHAHDLTVDNGIGELARRFKSSEEKIAQVVGGLIEAGYLRREGDGVVPVSRGFTNAAGLSKEISRNFHATNLDYALQKIGSRDFDPGDFGAITLAVSSEDREIIRREIQTFFRRIAALAQRAAKKDHVLRVSNQILTLDDGTETIAKAKK